MNNHLCMCGRKMEKRGAFYQCAPCAYVYKEETAGAPLVLVRVNGEKLTPANIGAEWFAKMRAAL